MGKPICLANDLMPEKAMFNGPGLFMDNHDIVSTIEKSSVFCNTARVLTVVAWLVMFQRRPDEFAASQTVRGRDLATCRSRALES